MYYNIFITYNLYLPMYNAMHYPPPGHYRDMVHGDLTNSSTSHRWVQPGWLNPYTLSSLKVGNNRGLILTKLPKLKHACIWIAPVWDLNFYINRPPIILIVGGGGAVH